MLAAHRKMRELRRRSLQGPKPRSGDFYSVARRHAASWWTRSWRGSIRRVCARERQVSAIEKMGSGWSVEAGGAAGIRRADYGGAGMGVGSLLKPVDAVLGRELSGIPYSSSITVESGLRRGEDRHLARGLRISGSGGRGPRDAGLHLCSSQVSGAHAAGQGRVSRLSGGHESRSAAGRERRGADCYGAARDERDSGREDVQCGR
jgi:hypothetical protein